MRASDWSTTVTTNVLCKGAHANKYIAAGVHACLLYMMFSMLAVYCKYTHKHMHYALTSAHMHNLSWLSVFFTRTCSPAHIFGEHGSPVRHFSPYLREQTPCQMHSPWRAWFRVQLARREFLRTGCALQKSCSNLASHCDPGATCLGEPHHRNLQVERR